MLSSIGCGPYFNNMSMSDFRKIKYQTLDTETKGKILSISPYQITDTSQNKKNKLIKAGYSFRYHYTVDDSIYKGFDIAMYEDFGTLKGPPEIDERVNQIYNIIVKFDSSKPSRSLLNLDKTFPQ